MLKRPGGEKMAMNDVECCEENCIHAELLKKAREKMPDEETIYKKQLKLANPDAG